MQNHVQTEKFMISRGSYLRSKDSGTELGFLQKQSKLSKSKGLDGFFISIMRVLEGLSLT
jgi:hypothetical protein